MEIPITVVQFVVHSLLSLLVLLAVIAYVIHKFQPSSTSVSFLCIVVILMIVLGIVLFRMFKKRKNNWTISVSQRLGSSIFVLGLVFILLIVLRVRESHMARFSALNWIVFSALFVVLAVIILLGIKLFHVHKKLKKTMQNEDDDMDEESRMPRKFSLKDLGSATENFSENKRIGGGGFGSVFRGNLADGTMVAVKRLDPRPMFGQGIKEFIAEVKTTGIINHLNLLKLVGCRCAANSLKFLVYEYISNGSLDKRIFPKNLDLLLSWETRKKIILDIDKGISYLHHSFQNGIIHLDVKPENILLDGEFNSKQSDFGLAKIVDRTKSQVLTAARGTKGYMAPECWKGRITEKADVYSFGIVVLEIVCGRRNLDHSLLEEYLTLRHLVREKAEANQLSDLVDKRSEDMQQNKEAAVKMIQVAISCLWDDGSKKPSMSMLVKILEDDLEPESITDYGFLTINPMTSSTEATAPVSAPPLPEHLSEPR